MVYGSVYMFETLLGNTTWFADHGYPLWLARWGPLPSPLPANDWQGQGWTFWQWSNTGTVPGITTDVDRDRYVGTKLSRATIASLTAQPDVGGSIADASGRLACAASTSCTELFSPTDPIELTATPDPGYAFVSWARRLYRRHADVLADRARRADRDGDLQPPVARARERGGGGHRYLEPGRDRVPGDVLRHVRAGRRRHAHGRSRSVVGRHVVGRLHRHRPERLHRDDGSASERDGDVRRSGPGHSHDQTPGRAERARARSVRRARPSRDRGQSRGAPRARQDARCASDVRGRGRRAHALQRRRDPERAAAADGASKVRAVPTSRSSTRPASRRSATVSATPPRGSAQRSPSPSMEPWERRHGRHRRRRADEVLRRAPRRGRPDLRRRGRRGVRVPRAQRRGQDHDDPHDARLHPPDLGRHLGVRPGPAPRRARRSTPRRLHARRVRAVRADRRRGATSRSFAAFRGGAGHAPDRARSPTGCAWTSTGRSTSCRTATSRRSAWCRRSCTNPTCWCSTSRRRASIRSCSRPSTR